MRDWLSGLLLLGIGIFTIMFRHKFRFEGPAGVAPLFDKTPTGKVEHAIVAGLGVLVSAIGLYLLLRAVLRSFWA